MNLKDIHVKYDKYDFRLQSAQYNSKNIKADSIQAAWTAEKKKGPVDNWACIEKLTVTQNGKVFQTEVEGLCFRTDNHKPRKNSGRPKRGFFDVDHLNITAQANLTIDTGDKDSLKIALNECTATDTITGIDLRELKAKAILSNGMLLLAQQEEGHQVVVLHRRHHRPCHPKGHLAHVFPCIG